MKRSRSAALGLERGRAGWGGGSRKGARVTGGWPGERMLRVWAELHALEGLQHPHVASYRSASGGTGGRLRLVVEMRDAGCTLAAALARYCAAALA